MKNICKICEGSGGYMRQDCKKCNGNGVIQKNKNMKLITKEEKKWILTKYKRPSLGMSIEYSEDGIDVYGTMVYISNRTCMLAGYAGGHGYFGEGFATDGNDCDYGLICDDPEYWREI